MSNKRKDLEGHTFSEFLQQYARELSGTDTYSIEEVLKKIDTPPHFGRRLTLADTVVVGNALRELLQLRLTAAKPLAKSKRHRST